MEETDLEELKNNDFVCLDYTFADKAAVIDLLNKVGLAKTKISKDLDVRLSLWADLMIKSRSEWRSIPLASKPYSQLNRYNGPSFRYRAMMRELKFGLRKGLIEIIRMPPCSHRAKAPKQSVIRPTPKLQALIGEFALLWVLHDPIRLNENVDCENQRVYAVKIPGRRYKRRLRAYKDTAQTEHWRAEIRVINEFLSSIKLEWKGVDRKEAGGDVIFDEDGLLLSTLYITRVFARSSFDCYGRCHGFWQNQKKHIRASIKLNGMPTSEPDYSTIHANVAYLEKGLIPPDEPYNIAGFDRELIKRTFAILLNARDLDGAISAVSTKFDISEEKASDVILAVKEHHALIIDQFHADAGIKLMRIDSDICISVMLKLVEERIPFLPIHDSFRVPVPDEDRVKEIMIEAFQERYPVFVCKVKS